MFFPKIESSGKLAGNQPEIAGYSLAGHFLPSEFEMICLQGCPKRFRSLRKRFFVNRAILNMQKKERF
jgi:hypothetical protein